MVKLISYPFRLGNNGGVVTIDEGEDYYADELAMLVKTSPGERELVPTYGISDPTFGEFDNLELLEQISSFGPPVDIVSSEARTTTDGRVSINIDFQELGPGSENELSNDDDYDYEDYETDEDSESLDPAYDFINDQRTLDGM